MEGGDWTRADTVAYGIFFVALAITALALIVRLT